MYTVQLWKWCYEEGGRRGRIEDGGGDEGVHGRQAHLGASEAAREMTMMRTIRVTTIAIIIFF